MEIKSNSKLTYLFYMYERSKWCRSVKMRLFTLLLPDAIKSNCNKSKYSRKNIFQICGKFATPSTSSNSNKENIADKLSMPFLVDSYESSFVNGGPKRLWRNRFSTIYVIASTSRDDLTHLSSWNYAKALHCRWSLKLNSSWRNAQRFGQIRATEPIKI